MYRDENINSLLDKNFKLFPVASIDRNGNCTCRKPECHSPGKHPLYSGWQGDATRKQDIIKQWINERANLGILVDSSFWVLDVEKYGLENLRELEKQYGKLPETFTVRSGGGGFHYYFKSRQGESFRNSVKIKLDFCENSGIDIRGQGGLLVAPGSIHKSGNHYEIVCDSALTEAPTWLVNLITNTSKKSKKKKNKTDLSLSPIISEGSRNESLISIAGTLRNRGLDEEAIEAALQGINSISCIPPLDESEVATIASSVSRYQKGNSNGEKMPHSEVAKVIMQDLSFVTDKFNNIYLYRDGIWQQCGDAELQSIVHEYELVESKSTKSRRNEVINFIKSSTYRHLIPWRNIKTNQIPLNNGIFDLGKNTLVDFNSEFYLETKLPHDFDEKGSCPLWERVLEDFFYDEPKKILLLQEYFGYIIMPHAKYKKALFCFGPANTGKSIIPQIVEKLVGQINVCSLPLDRLSDSRQIAPIKGKLVSTKAELPNDHRIDESGFKQLVSTGDIIEIDPKFGQKETYIPFCKLLICTNKMPVYRDESNALLERVMILDFVHAIPDDKQDRELVEKLEAEIKGIMRWALIGAKRLYDNKGMFTIPESSIKALKVYEEMNNPIKTWADESLERCEHGVISFHDLLTDFYEWLRNNPQDFKFSKDAFAKALKRAGYETQVVRVGDGKPGCKLVGYRFIR